MTTCNYCGATINIGLNTCPHCGGDLTNKPEQTIKIESKASFVIQATFKQSYVLRRNTVLFILIPFFVAPMIVTMLTIVPFAIKEGENLSTTASVLLAMLMLLSIPGSFMLLRYNYRRKAEKTKCLVGSGELEYMSGGAKKRISLMDLVSIDSAQTTLQSKYKIGDIKIGLNNIGANNVITLNNVDDFDNSLAKLRSYAASMQFNNKQSR